MTSSHIESYSQSFHVSKSFHNVNTFISHEDPPFFTAHLYLSPSISGLTIHPSFSSRTATEIAIKTAKQGGGKERGDDDHECS